MSYNYITSYNSPNYTPAASAKAVFGQARVIKGITIHWYGDPKLNPTAEGVRDYLCRAGGNTSAHLVVTGTGRKAYCIVNYPDVAWHSGNATGNATTIGIECDPRCRDEDYDVVAEVVADIRSAFGDVPIYAHKMWSPTACPGNYDIDRIDRLSYTKKAGAQWGQVTNKTPAPVTVIPAPQPTAPQPVPPTSPTTITATGQPVPGSGQPIAEKPDYGAENNALLKQILAIVQAILAKLTNIFK